MPANEGWEKVKVKWLEASCIFHDDSWERIWIIYGFDHLEAVEIVRLAFIETLKFRFYNFEQFIATSGGNFGPSILRSRFGF